MMNVLKRIARKILKDELRVYSDRIIDLQCDRDTLVNQCGDLNRELDSVKRERNAYKARIAASIKYILPNSVVAKIISVLPNPINIGLMPVKIDKDYIIKGDPVTIKDEKYGGWFFEVKFERLKRISNVKVLLEVVLRNNNGRARLEIPATVGKFFSENAEFESWCWNIYECGLTVVPDDIYNVVNSTTKAWNEIKHELVL